MRRGNDANLVQAGRRERQEITRKLRQAKRQLLLKSAEQPSSPVDQLRGILLQLSVDSMNGGIDMDESSPSRDSYPMFRVD
jgi:hypothetical protein